MPSIVISQRARRKITDRQEMLKETSCPQCRGNVSPVCDMCEGTGIVYEHRLDMDKWNAIAHNMSQQGVPVKEIDRLQVKEVQDKERGGSASDVIEFTLREHKDNGMLAIGVEQGEDLILIPVETAELGIHMAEEIAKAMQTYGNCGAIVRLPTTS